MYCVMRASVPSLYNVYRRYDSDIVTTDAMISCFNCVSYTQAMHTQTVLNYKAQAIYMISNLLYILIVMTDTFLQFPALFTMELNGSVLSKCTYIVCGLCLVWWR